MTSYYVILFNYLCVNGKLKMCTISAIIENLTEFRPEVSNDAVKQGLLLWLLRRLKLKLPFDANKLYASEMLSILLQDNDTNRQTLGELDGIDALLQQLAVSCNNFFSSLFLIFRSKIILLLQCSFSFINAMILTLQKNRK